jgi:glycyl-tRNA synthetase beta subunit
VRLEHLEALHETGGAAPPSSNIADWVTRPTQQKYLSALRGLSSLQRPIDRFFDEVMVMAEDPAVRSNHLALLSELDLLCRSVADISCLPG